MSSPRPSLEPSAGRKWARAKGAGAHGLRRGAWYLVVNDTQPAVVVLDVRRTNVPVPRDMLEVRKEKPNAWSVVKWEETQRGARRASDHQLGLLYAVCPSCGERGAIEPPDAARLTCQHCHGTFDVDWDHPC